MTRKKDFLKNGLYLAATTLLLRTVGVFYNAYISNAVGAEGMGLYTLVMSVYGFAVTFATSGIGYATMRLTAEALGKGQYENIGKVLRKCLLYATLFGGCAAVLIGFGAPFIGDVLLSDARTVPALRLFSLSLMPISLSAVFGGYYSAVRKARRNAFCNIFEMAVRIFLTVSFVEILAPHGMEYACLALVGGGTIAEMLSFLFMLFSYLLVKERRALRSKRKCADIADPGTDVGKLLPIALPIAAGSYMRSGLTTVEHILIPKSLTGAGESQCEALASYGALHGMALPILLYPAGILSSFSGLLLPEAAESAARGDTEHIRRVTEKALRYAYLFSLVAAGNIFLLSDILSTDLYHNGEAGLYMAALVPLVPVMYMDTTVDNILKGMGEQLYCMGVNIADAGVSVALVLLLLPRFGTLGYVGVLLISEVFNFTCSVWRLYSRVPFQLNYMRDVFSPTALTALLSLAAKIVTRGIGISWITVIPGCLLLTAVITTYAAICFSPHGKRNCHQHYCQSDEKSATVHKKARQMVKKLEK